ncbi:MAG: J domain-containing protein [Pseudomonadota bacterium]
MFKFAVILLLFCILFRWAFGSWPWQMLSTKPAGAGSPSIAKARALLGVSAGADAEEIRAAHKRLVGEVHPDRGGSADAFHAANEARDLLLAQAGEKRAKEREDS